MLKAIMFAGLMTSNFALAENNKKVLTCDGKNESDTYELVVEEVPALKEGRPSTFVAKLNKNSKAFKSPTVKAFDADKHYGYEARDLKISIAHAQLADIAVPMARGTIQIFLSDAWLQVKAMCNTKPAQK